MEKTQTNTASAARRVDRRLTGTAAGAAPFELSYLNAAQFAQHQAHFRSRLLGAIAFSATRPAITEPACPYAWVNLPVLGGDAVFEVWTSPSTVLSAQADGLAAAHNDELMFGCVTIEPDGLLDKASFSVYSRIFDFIDRHGYGHLLRVWNYVPQINADESGLERYARFNVGRHDAFMAKQRIIGSGTPAASALGTRGKHLTVYFLAAKHAGRIIENPRQTSAFHYPPQYGPRSPTFVRAMLQEGAGQPQLFISGTSSIVGHSTLHAGDAAAQARETVANLLAVIGQAQRSGFDASSPHARLLLKAYLRNAGDLAMTRTCLLQAFGPDIEAVYLQADVCRAELLVEVEAAYLHQAAPLL